MMIHWSDAHDAWQMIIETSQNEYMRKHGHRGISIHV